MDIRRHEPAAAGPAAHIHVRGARQHNLKNIEVVLPRNKLVVITGLSGSGKSSLAVDTLYAEGQRRYVETLSTHTRQFLQQMERPDVDMIEGLSPAISIEQRPQARTPRSTVGTATEIYDFLRLLFAKAGTPHCPRCGRQIDFRGLDESTERLLSLPEGTKVMILAPFVEEDGKAFKQRIARLQREGFLRVRYAGVIWSLEDEIPVEGQGPHALEVVVDRIVLKPGIRARLADSTRIAAALSDGLVRAAIEAAGAEPDEWVFGRRSACLQCGYAFPEISPRLFSFNSPYGACPACDGLGTTMAVDPDRVVPDPSLSLRQGALHPWREKRGSFPLQVLESLAAHYRFDLDTPFARLPAKIRRVLLYGSGRESILFRFGAGSASENISRPFEGVVTQLERLYREAPSEEVRAQAAAYMDARPCPSCKGSRLRPEALSVRVGGKDIGELTAMSVRDARGFFSRLSLSPFQEAVVGRVVEEIVRRLGLLEDLGVGYLGLDRETYSLSGGEAQRIQLATHIGSGLVGVMYVLDEPTVGLHARDGQRLMETLRGLRDAGNTVIMVEHDEACILGSDYVVDMGPGAGLRGGEVVFSGPPDKLKESERSLTGLYLSGRAVIPLPSRRRKASKGFLEIRGACHNNLKNIDVKIPVGLFTCVTGVSGSGKSSLVIDTVYKAMARYLHRSREVPGRFASIRGVELFDRVVEIDQAPLGRTPRSNAATYTGVFALLRDLFAQLPESRLRGYGPSQFSFNVEGGRCEACKGEGVRRIEMHFLPDVHVVCDVCKGKRYSRQTLEVRYRGRSIADILEMTVEEARAFLEPVPRIVQWLSILSDVGVGYIQLGQPATRLSGGEAQRIKLARELGKQATGRTLYILDEPTTGLHFADIERLLLVLERLAEAGNTVVVIEHNLEVIKSADYVIDLGPEGGEAGGFIVAHGTPEEIAEAEESHTGRFLRPVLERSRAYA
jgi:excinuclease ABC subunit A